MALVLTLDELREVADHYSKVPAFAFDVETIGEHRGEPVRNDVVWLSLACDGRTDVIPMGHPHGEFVRYDKPLTAQGKVREAKGLPLTDKDYRKTGWTTIWGDAPVQLTPAQVFQVLEPVFFGDAIKVAHNLKFDVESIAKYYGKKIMPPKYFCTMIATLLINSLNRGKADLASVAQREVGAKLVKGVGKDVSLHPFSAVYRYSYLDSKLLWLSYKSIVQKLEQRKMTKVMDLEMDLIECVMAMELEGAPIDEAALEDLHDSLLNQIDKALTDVYREAGFVLNISSNETLSKLMYSPKKEGGRGLKPQMLTDAGEKIAEAGGKLDYKHYSVNEKALSPHANKDPLVDVILEYKGLEKLFGTYVLPYIGGSKTSAAGKTKAVESLLINGRIHARFNQMGADTSRFSSSSPNLQNIPNPSKSDNGRAIRDCFYAPEGYKLVVADYSQIEPRIIASFSKDRVWCDAYTRGEDIYMAIAEEMDVTRSVAKVLVLAISYGTGPDTIARVAHCTMKEAQHLIDSFGERFSSIATYKRQVIQETRARTPHYVTTILGHRRYIPTIASTEPKLRMRGERQAFNTKIQGSAADIIKLAMIRSYRSLPEGAKMICTVHDEILTLTPNHLVDETHEAIRSSMEDINMLSIPLVADIKVVQRWGEAK